MDFNIGNMLGLFALLSLIPLILLYFIRPKPVNIKVPSLMFFLSKEKSTTAENFLKYFHKDILFIIQLLVLLFLALSITDPNFITKRDVVSDNIVFILDISASSSVIENNGLTRLDIAKNKIKDLVASKNSLVLLKSFPVLALQNVGRSELLHYLDSVKSTDSVSDISSAISFSGELIPEGRGRIVILSDFIQTKGFPFDIAKNVIESRGTPVDLISTRLFNRNNVGFVDMVISGNDINLYIKNYNAKPVDVDIISGGNSKSVHINAGSIEPYVFSLADDNIEIELVSDDDFKADNKIYISKPFSDKIKVLLITNENPKYIKAALNSIPGVDLSIGTPPIIPNEDYDIYIIAGLNKNEVLPGTFDNILEKVSEGKSVVITPQIDLKQIDTTGIVPFEIIGISPGGSVNIDQVTKFSNDVDFGNVGRYIDVENFYENYVSIASVNNVSVMGIVDKGSGKIFYYGIFDDESDFKLTPEYPVFWNNLIGFLVGKVDLNDVNLKTGSIIDIANRSIVLDKAGFFNIGNSEFAVNLLDIKESDINFISPVGDIKKAGNIKLEAVSSDYEFKLEVVLLILALLLVIIEIIYIKYRGEI